MKKYLLALLVTATACGGSGDGDTGSGIEAVASLSFEQVDLGEGILADVPVGWTQDEGSQVFRPPEGGDLDPLRVSYRVGSNCAGECGSRSATEWAATVSESQFVQYDNEDAFTILRSEDFDGGTLILAENNFELISFEVAMWAEGAEQFFNCQFTGSVALQALVGSFEEACRSATVPFLN